MQAGTLIEPLAEGGCTLALASGATWSNRFIAGPENALLVCAVAELCRGEASLYNPLVLHGPPGSGKTHVAYGIAQHVHEVLPAAQVIYLTGSEFAGDYAEAVETRSVPAWRAAQRSAALFVLDDLGQLADKRPAQIELLHTIDALVDQGKQVLVTCSRPLQRLTKLLPALTSRLTAGLAVGLNAPRAKTRYAALRQIASERSLHIDEDTLRLLAEKVTATIAELSGILHELAADCATGLPIDRAQVLKFLKNRQGPRAITLRDVAQQTARHFALPVADLRGPSRRQQIANARAVAMYLARQVTGKSLGAVGAYFGGRDHTTVLHGCRKTEQLLATDATLRQVIFDLRMALGDA